MARESMCRAADERIKERTRLQERPKLQVNNDAEKTAPLTSHEAEIETEANNSRRLKS